MDAVERSAEACLERGGPPVGAVASAHPLASAAGHQVLEQGGTAFDAAVAVASALTVVEPMMSGLGGYGTILVYDARRARIRYLNASGRFPLKADSDLMRPPTPGFLANRTGPKAVSTPGNLNAWKELHRTYGSRPWSSLFAGAIACARDGVPVSPHAAAWIAAAFDNFADGPRRFYGRDGRPLREGEPLVQADLARTFELIAAEGPEPFYRGAIARRIDEQLQAAGSFLAREDLERDAAEWWEPVHVPYRGFEVYTAGMPSNAYPGLFLLGVMEAFGPAALERDSGLRLHLLAEAAKASCRVRLTHPGELEARDHILEHLLTPARFRAVAGAVDRSRASAFALSAAPAGDHTTHFVVVDRWGNIVSATQTLGNMFGSRIMIEGTGIWMNNSMAYASFEPKGNPMDVRPGRYKVSGDCPVIMLRDGRPWAALGSPGGHTITQNVPQVILNLVDFGMTMQEAIDAPKLAFIEDDRSLRVEAGVSGPRVAALEAMGHRVVPGMIGNAMGVRMAGGTAFDVGVDRRWDGHLPLAGQSL